MISDISFIIRYPEFDTFLERFSTFTSTKYRELIRYYNGDLVNISEGIIEELNSLIKEYDYIIGRIDITKHRLSDNIEMWDIMLLLDDIGVRLQTIKNTPKWLRSSFYLEYSDKQTVKGLLKNNQSLESLIDDIGVENSDEEWADVAVINNLFEQDYSYEGNKNIDVKIDFSQNTGTFNSVDIMQGNNILGKDLNREILIVDGDLLFLDTKSTLEQSSEIILEITKGSIPEFRELGVNKEQISSNIASFQYPSLMRQLTETFSQDDSFESIELVDISQDRDSTLMKLIISSKTGDQLDKSYRIFDDTFDNTYN